MTTGRPRFEHVPVATVPVRRPGEVRVLHISFDRAIRETRDAILRAAGFRVLSVSTLKEVVAACRNYEFDAVVVGHTIPTAERGAVLAAARACRSKPRVIAMYKLAPDEITGADVALDSHDSPDFLIQTLRSRTCQRCDR